MSIPPCQYLQQKSTGRILPWSPFLAERPDEFEPFKKAPPKPDLSNRERDNAPVVESKRMGVLLEAIDMLDPSDFNDKGAPKIEALRKLVDNDVTLEERNTAWSLLQEQRKALGK